MSAISAGIPSRGYYYNMSKNAVPRSGVSALPVLLIH